MLIKHKRMMILVRTIGGRVRMLDQTSASGMLTKAAAAAVAAAPLPSESGFSKERAFVMA